MSAERDRAIDLLRDVDARLGRTVRLRTLDPARDAPTPLADLGAGLLGGDTPGGFPLAFAESLGKIAEAQLEAFPGNLFWDFDFLAGALARTAGLGAGALAELCRIADLIVRLHVGFGGDPVRFQYAHDFVYGFDWAKWVTKAPTERADTAPFDPVFLHALLSRAGELRDLIERDDAVYPRLRDDAPRNPFSFSREPEHEARLLQSLASSGSVPVAAWSVGGPAVWDRPFQRLRAERARDLGIPRGAASNPIA